MSSTIRARHSSPVGVRAWVQIRGYFASMSSYWASAWVADIAR